MSEVVKRFCDRCGQEITEDSINYSRVMLQYENAAGAFRAIMNDMCGDCVDEMATVVTNFLTALNTDEAKELNAEMPKFFKLGKLDQDENTDDFGV